MEAKLTQSEVRGIYDSISGVYDVWANLTERRARQRLLSFADIQNEQNVLEVAVGTGLTAAEVLAVNVDGVTTGIDISANMLERAHRRLGKLRSALLVRGDAFHMPYAAQTFDVVINCYMLDLIPTADMDAIICEFRRVLKPGGRLALANMTAGRTAVSRFYSFLYRVSPRLMGGCRPVAVTELLAGRGFVVEAREYIEQFFFPSEVVLAVRT